MISKTNVVGALRALGAAVVLCTSAVASAAPEVTIVDKDLWGWNSGGPFEVRDHDFGFKPAGRGLYGAASDTFVTFCVERFAPINEGSTYGVEFSMAADHGGPFGSSDPLDDRTAFLYTAFVQGTLDDKLGESGHSFEYEDWYSGLSLQQAIWNIEQDQLLISSLAKALVALADDAVAEGGEWYGKGLGDVRVMNLSYRGFSGGNVQDLLVMIPLPMPVMLGLVGLVGVIMAAIRRRRRLMTALDGLE